MMFSLILKVATRLLVGLILIYAVYLLFRGHNDPGGGFSAALVAGTGFALFSFAEGPRRVREAIRTNPQKLAMAGLGISILSGLCSIIVGKPFLTGLWWEFEGSGGSILTIGTPIFFDIGVFLAVLGTILTLVLALEEN
jgi:multisubunit Na+/H+ antiporter MnhB subunit